jgi:Pyruvate/2-oxoglutarate dehydrogenase complex, dihydrolipoamide dehydrogenase (E3) component, and related enzymes
VTVLVRGERVLTREDADFADSVQKVLASEGIEFVFGVQPRGSNRIRITRTTCASA